MFQVLKESQRLKKVEVLRDKEIKELLKEKRVVWLTDLERDLTEKINGKIRIKAL